MYLFERKNYSNEIKINLNRNFHMAPQLNDIYMYNTWWNKETEGKNRDIPMCDFKTSAQRVRKRREYFYQWIFMNRFYLTVSGLQLILPLGAIFRATFVDVYLGGAAGKHDKISYFLLLFRIKRFQDDLVFSPKYWRHFSFLVPIWLSMCNNTWSFVAHTCVT